MAQQNINFGAYLGDLSADKTRDAFLKTQSNFTELYSQIVNQAAVQAMVNTAVATYLQGLGIAVPPT